MPCKGLDSKSSAAHFKGQAPPPFSTPIFYRVTLPFCGLLHPILIKTICLDVSDNRTMSGLSEVVAVDSGNHSHRPLPASPGLLQGALSAPSGVLRPLSGLYKGDVLLSYVLLSEMGDR